jgi:hypothetical protein
MDNFKHTSKAEANADYYITSPDYSHPNLGRIYLQIILSINMYRLGDLKKANLAFDMVESEFITTRKMDLKTFDDSFKYFMGKVLNGVIEGGEYEQLQREFIDAFSYYSGQKLETKEQLIGAIEVNPDQDLAYKVLIRAMTQRLAGKFNFSDALPITIEG